MAPKFQLQLRSLTLTSLLACFNLGLMAGQPAGSLAAPGQERPTLQEALDWISDKLQESEQLDYVMPDSEDKKYPYWRIGYPKDFSFGGCHIQWQRESARVLDLGREQQKESRVQINLADLDPERTEAFTVGGAVTWGKSASAIRLVTRDRGKRRRIAERTRTLPKPFKWSEWSEDLARTIVLKDNLGEERLVKAFKHAIRLCGGKTKKEPF